MGRSANRLGGVFSNKEAAKLRNGWGPQRVRLDGGAALPPDACCVCVSPAEAPVACPRGHLMCRECAVRAMVAQRERRKEEEAEADAERRAARDEGERRDERARQEEARAFAAREDGRSAAASSSSSSSSSSKPGLPSFWIAELTPSAQPGDEKKVKKKRRVLCPSAEPHPLRLKELRDVRFTANEKGGGGARHACPACRRGLTVASRVFVLPRCGHALCGGCAALCGKDRACSVCAAPCAGAGSAAVLLRTGGTGFAAGGAREVTASVAPSFG